MRVSHLSKVSFNVPLTNILQSIPLYFEALHALRQQPNVSQCQVLLYQQRILYVESTLYSFVYGACLAKARSYIEMHQAHERLDPSSLCDCFNKVHAHDQWLLRLVVRLNDLLVISPNNYTLHPEHFLPGLTKATPFVHVTVGNRNRYHTGPVEEQAILNAIRSILYHWLNIPNDKNAEYRSVIVDIFHNLLGPGALLMPSVWDICLNPPAWIYSSCSELQRIRRGVDDEPLEIFAKCVQLLPAHQEYVRGKGLIQELWEKYKILGMALRTEGKSLLTSRLTNSALDSTSSSSATPVSLFNTFLTFLRDSLRSITGELPPTHALYTSLSNESDFFLPLREKASSRAHFITKVTKDFLRTPQGLFNLLVFRVLLFNSPAVREVNYDFTLETFECFWNSNQLRYMYNPGAYGTTSGGRRNPEIFRLYWILSHTFWPGLIERNDSKLSRCML